MTSLRVTGAWRVPIQVLQARCEWTLSHHPTNVASSPTCRSNSLMTMSHWSNWTQSLSVFYAAVYCASLSRALHSPIISIIIIINKIIYKQWRNFTFCDFSSPPPPLCRKHCMAPAPRRRLLYSCVCRTYCFFVIKRR